MLFGLLVSAGTVKEVQHQMAALYGFDTYQDFINFIGKTANNPADENSDGGGDPKKKKVQSNWGSTVDRTNWSLTTSTVGLQTSEASFRLSTSKKLFSPKYYASGWWGNQYVTTYNISKIGTIASRGLVFTGIGVDSYRWYSGEISGSKFSVNTGVGLYGLTGVGTIPSIIYFGVEAFYPGGIEGAAKDNARWQIQADAIMNTNNNGTHFYLMPWGAQKL